MSLRKFYMKETHLRVAKLPLSLRLAILLSCVEK